MIPRLDRRDVGADPLDDSRCLVTEDHRHRITSPMPRAVDHVIIAMTGAGGFDLDKYLVVLRSLERDVFDQHGCLGFVKDRCAHHALPSTSASPS